MQYVNDDMDEIFRRAGKDYPLDTSGADWDKIAAGLQNVAIVPKKGDNRRYLWLLLLLPLPWLCMKYAGNGKDENMAVQEKTVQKQENVLPEPSNLQQNQESSSQHLTKQNIIEEKTAIVNSETPRNNLQQGKLKTSSVAAAKTNGQGRSKPASRLGNAKQNDQISGLPVSNNSTTATVSRQQDPKPVKEDKQSDIISGEKSAISNDAVVETRTQTSTAVAEPVKITEQEKAREQDKKDKQRKERFYLAPVAGFSVTSIKGQKLSDPGTDYGILAGVKITPRIAVEAGLLSTRKNYYSEGSYYDKTRIYMPANSKLTTVSGDCRMLEIPVTVKFDFTPAKRAHWFAAAGISNYLMKQEHYDYTYYYYSTNYYATYHKTYNNASQDYMSVLQLSGGYNYSIRSGFRFRLEPYVQLPLKGVGYGDLPLTSYGLRIGIEKGFKF